DGAIFCDVSGNYVFADEIEWLSAQGITTGYPDGDFNPRRRITREAIAAFMYRNAGRPSFKAPSQSPFKDLSRSDPFYKEITWLADQGITTGYDDGTFRPGNKISREAMAAFLYRYAGAEGYQARGQEFSDVPTGYVFADEIAGWPTRASPPGTTTGPSGPATRSPGRPRPPSCTASRKPETGSGELEVTPRKPETASGVHEVTPRKPETTFPEPEYPAPH